MMFLPPHTGRYVKEIPIHPMLRNEKTLRDDGSNRFGHVVDPIVAALIV